VYVIYLLASCQGLFHLQAPLRLAYQVAAVVAVDVAVVLHKVDGLLGNQENYKKHFPLVVAMFAAAAEKDKVDSFAVEIEVEEGIHCHNQRLHRHHHGFVQLELQ
jgi:hypothetical protein